MSDHECNDALRCEACGAVVEEKDAVYPLLCLKCASIDEQTDLLLDAQFYEDYE